MLPSSVFESSPSSPSPPSPPMTAHDSGAIPSDTLMSEMAQMREEVSRLRQVIQERDEPPPGYDHNPT
jgi:hypothetical protein